MNKQVNNNIIKTLNIVRGEKGGVGKTFFSRLLVSYYDFANRPTELFDADSGNKYLKKYYPQAKKINNQSLYTLIKNTAT